MLENQPWYVIALGAGLVGFIIGGGVSGGDDVEEALEGRFSAVEAAIAENKAQSETLGTAVAEMSAATAESLAGVSDLLGAVQADLTAQNAVLGEGQAALDTKVEELNGQVAGHGEAMDAIAAQVAEAAAAKGDGVSATELVAALQLAYKGHHQGHHGKGHGGKHGEGHHKKAAPSDEAAAAEPEETVAATEAAAEPAAEPEPKVTGESATSEVGTGQTVQVGDVRFFISGFDGNKVNGIVFPGNEKISLDVFTSPLELGGCTLTLDDIKGEDGLATLSTSC